MSAACISDLPSKGNILLVQHDTLLPAALELLVQHNILSVPVIVSFDGLENLQGHLDMVCICSFVIDLFGTLNSHSTEEEFSTLQRKFQKTQVAELLARYGGSDFCPVPEDAKIKELYPLLSTYELHRVPVISSSGKIVRVISQSDIVKFLTTILPPNALQKKLSTCDFVVKPVITVRLGEIVFEAFKTITKERISAVGVVDEEGHLVGNISSTDIRSFGVNATFSSRLFWTIDKFLQSKVIEFSAPRTVVSAKLNNSLQEVMDLINRFHLHRVYITDEHEKPIGILSLTDFLKILQGLF